MWTRVVSRQALLVCLSSLFCYGINRCSAFVLRDFSSLSWQADYRNILCGKCATKTHRSPVVLASEKRKSGDLSQRENEIRKTLAALKKAGRLKPKKSNRLEDNDEPNTEAPESKTLDDEDIQKRRKQQRIDDDEDYQNKVRKRLGSVKSKMLGFLESSYTGDADDEDETLDTRQTTEDGPGSFSEPEQPSLSKEDEPKACIEYQTIRIDPSLFDDDDDGFEDEELSEEELVDLVAAKLFEQQNQEPRETNTQIMVEVNARLETLEDERVDKEEQNTEVPTTKEAPQTTSGVGGSWSKTASTNATQDLYKPKSGSWGAFPRPRDISKAYGGGRRIGPGYSNEALDAEKRQQAADATRERLRQYREKVGIDVASEKEHAQEIEEAMQIATLAMQRGVYATAVSALEKVTPYCSSNSRVGGKVFLELGMAYEAIGRPQQAITVYKTLSKCRIEEIKFDAKRLLLGIEAMQFMQQELGRKEFSRIRARNTFIDTTGLADIARQFDDVYQTAYVDRSGSFFKRLSESTVRTPREARQVLLQAIAAANKNEEREKISRMRVVQALRLYARQFDDALQSELARIKEPTVVAVIDGKPIFLQEEEDELSKLMSGSGRGDGSYVLADAEQMRDNLQGEWKLQLLADKTGDGVKFTSAWQRIDWDSEVFESRGPFGLFSSNVQCSGQVNFNEKRRIVRRSSVVQEQVAKVPATSAAGSSSSFGMLSGWFPAPSVIGLWGNGTPRGEVGAVTMPQQVMLVDSVLLITRHVPSRNKNVRNEGNKDKDHFAVWTRADYDVSQ